MINNKNIKSDSLKVTNQLTSNGNFNNSDGFIFLGKDYNNQRELQDDNVLPNKSYCGTSETRGNVSRPVNNLNNNGPILLNNTADDSSRILNIYPEKVSKTPWLSKYPWLNPNTQEWSNDTQESLDLNIPIYKCLGKGIGEIHFLKTGTLSNGDEDAVGSTVNIENDGLTCQTFESQWHNELIYPYSGEIYSGTLVQLVSEEQDGTVITKVVPYQQGRGILYNALHYKPDDAVADTSYPPYGELQWPVSENTIQPCLAPGVNPGENNYCVGMVVDTFSGSPPNRRMFRYQNENAINDTPYVPWYNHPAPFTVPPQETDGLFLSPENSAGTNWSPWPRDYAYRTDEPIPILTRGITTARIGATHNIAIQSYGQPVQVSATDTSWIPTMTIPLFDGEELQAGSYVYASLKGHAVSLGPRLIDYDRPFFTGPTLTPNEEYLYFGPTAWNPWIDSTAGNIGWTGTPGLSFTNIPDRGVNLIEIMKDQDDTYTNIPYLNQANQGSIIVHPVTTNGLTPTVGANGMTSFYPFIQTDNAIEYLNNRLNVEGISGRANLVQTPPEKAVPIGVVLETVRGKGKWTYTGLITNPLIIENLRLTLGGVSLEDVIESGTPSKPVRGVTGTGLTVIWTENDIEPPYLGTITGGLTVVAPGSGYSDGQILTVTNTEAVSAGYTPLWKDNNVAFRYYTSNNVVQLHAGGSGYVDGDYVDTHNMSLNNLYIREDVVGGVVTEIVNTISADYPVDVTRYSDDPTKAVLLQDGVPFNKSALVSITDSPYSVTVDDGGEGYSPDGASLLFESQQLGKANPSVSITTDYIYYENWTTQVSAVDNNWNSVVWSPELGIFCAVSSSGSGNRVMTSPDGITWTSQASAVDNTWLSVTWSPELGIFCAVSNTGGTDRAMTSPDGITWTSQTTPNNSWSSVVWSPELGIFCAVSVFNIPNQVMTSPDGITWTTQLIVATNNDWQSITWSPELSVFCTIASSRVAISSDGITWTTQSLTSISAWRSVIWSSDLGLFCAVSNFGISDAVIVSQDGLNWLTQNTPTTNWWQSVTWSSELGLFCAVSISGTGDRIMISGNGVDWITQSSPEDNNWRSVIWSPDLLIFCAVSNSGSGNRVMISDYQNFISELDILDYGIGNNAGDIVLIKTGDENATFRYPSLPFGEQELFIGAPSYIIGGNYNMIKQGETIIIQNEIVLKSIYNRSENIPNLIDIVPTYPTLIENNQVYNMVNPLQNTGESEQSIPDPWYVSRRCATIVDTIQITESLVWVTRVSAVQNQWRSITWSPELLLFVAVSVTGTDNRVMTSPNGITWTSQSTPVNNDWRSVTWSPELELFCAVADGSGSGNRVMTSPDGIVWTSRSCANNQWRSVTWSSDLGLFCAVGLGLGFGLNDDVMTSTDGIVWTTRSVPIGFLQGNAVTWSSDLGIFCAVSDTNTMTSLDGITWITQTSISNNWISIVWSAELGLFCAVSNTGGTDRAMTSPDGITWTSQTTPNNDWSSVTWSPELGLFCAVTSIGAGNRAMVSLDGITWTTQLTPVNSWYSVVWSPELYIFCAVASGGSFNRVMTTTQTTDIDIRLHRGGSNYTTATDVSCYNLSANSLRLRYTVTGGLITAKVAGDPINTEYDYNVGRYTFGANGTVLTLLDNNNVGTLEQVRLLTADNITTETVVAGSGYSVADGDWFFQTQRTDQTNPTVDITVDSNGYVRRVKLNTVGTNNVDGDLILITQDGSDLNAVFLFNNNLPIYDFPPYITVPYGNVSNDEDAWKRYADVLSSAENLLDKQVLIELRPMMHPNYNENITPPPTQNSAYLPGPEAPY